MRNLLQTIVVGLCVSSGGVYAQEIDFRETVYLGFKGGINHASAWEIEGRSFDPNPRQGFVIGVFAGIPLGKVIGFQPEMQLSQRGFSANSELLGLNYSFERNTVFLDLQLLMQLKATSQLTLVAGPQFAFLMLKKDEYSFGANSVVLEQEFDRDNLRNTLPGFVAGVEFNYSWFVCSGRTGFDLLANKKDGESFTPRYKNRWLQLAIGMRF
jgi:hypothetical protein